MGHRRRREAGPQHHAEGQHGDKTHRAFIEQLHQTQTVPAEGAAPSLEGHQRLHEDRAQHDEAEKGSEKVELMREDDKA